MDVGKGVRLLLELCDHVFDARDRLDLISMARLEKLHERTLGQTAKDRKVIHLIPRQNAARMIATIQTNRRPIYQMIGVPRLAIFTLQHLNARPVIGFETEVVSFIVSCLDRQAIGVMLVRGKT